MNILVPVSWLGEYIETKMTPEELAALGSLHGPSFERIEQIEGEPVYDIEITTNRVDAMSIKGLARELAAIAGEKVKPKKLKETPHLEVKLQTQVLPLPKIRVETEAVNKIVCLVLDDVKNSESPEWMQKRLRQIGQNTHGIIIDMSNYVTHELGHPCHTFDYDKVMSLGGEIVVKQAQKGKKFVTLDGNEYETVGGEVVFENGEGEIIDLPAIKGTANTAISPETRRVLFWLENMEAPIVRQASMSHAIRTVAAILNEKNVDPYLADEVLALGTQILQREAGAKIASKVYSYEHERIKKMSKPIKFDLERLNRYLGVTIAPKRVEKILTALGFAIEKTKPTIWTVTAPTFRAHDVTIQEDLIEEVARIYGYHLLPSRTDFTLVQIPKQPQFDFALETRLKHLLVDRGLTEVYTYSMISENQVTGDPKKWLRLENPLTEDKEYLRQSLIPSLEAVYQNNNLEVQATAGFFELANVYFPGKTRDSVDEQLHLAWVTTLPYREARVLVDEIARQANIKVKVDKTGKIVGNGQELGWIRQQADGKIASEWSLISLVTARQKPIISGKLRQGALAHEDLTFVLPTELAIGELMERMKAVSEKLVKVSLGDIYQDHVTFHFVYQKMVGSLEAEEIRPLRQKVVALVEKLGGKLVGQLEEGGHE